jgi:hypothetical protein
MATFRDTKVKNDEIIPPTVDKKKWKKRPWSNAEFLRRLRQERENVNFGNRMEHFFGTPLSLKADLPLPDYATKFSYPAYRVEQLQDVCNKATVIYGTDSNTWGIPLYHYIFGQLLFLSLICLLFTKSCQYAFKTRTLLARPLERQSLVSRSFEEKKKKKKRNF